MMKNLFVLGILTLSLLNQVHAQKGENEIITEFFRIFEESPIDALDYGFSTNKWFKGDMTPLENVKFQYKNTLPHLGQYYGYDLINENLINERFMIVSYLIRYERQPVRFNFVLYKPYDSWQVLNFTFDDNLVKELIESVELDKLKKE